MGRAAAAPLSKEEEEEEEVEESTREAGKVSFCVCDVAAEVGLPYALSTIYAIGVDELLASSGWM